MRLDSYASKRLLRIIPALGAVFVAALLVFSVQPMAARSLLAWYGGAPMVWAVSLFFFQACLLAGYLYAHLLATRVRTGAAVVIHGVALIAAFVFFMPPLPDSAWAPAGTEAPAGRILLTLLTTFGLPFAALSATTPLVSAWTVRAGAGDAVYRLYALSNAGSLVGLAAYPLVLEPALDLSGQAALWAWGFAAAGAMVLPAGVLAVRAARGRRTGARGRDRSGRGAAFHPAAFGLAAIGSLTLIAVTTHLTRDVAAAPFLWTLPLGLYLVTFIVAFRGGSPYPRRLVPAALAIFVAACLWVWFQDITYGALGNALFAHGGASLGFLFFACWLIHGELALRKPPASGLTGYYLSLTAGGAAGGLAASLGSPLLFPNVWEYPLALVLAAGVASVVPKRDGVGGRAVGRRLLPAGVALGLALAVTALEHRRPLRAERSFFGVVRVMEAYPGTEGWRRDLWHGGIAHGSQWMRPDRRREPVLYYYAGTGIDAAMRLHPRRRLAQPLRVGVVGLGAGALLVHSRRNDVFRFYELDPQVEEIARSTFTYLADTPATVEVVIGDGRLRLAEEDAAGAPGWDVLVLDAFTGDAIPVHLLTREAFELYARRLAPGGVLAVHISNRHVDLAPVLRAHSVDMGMMALLMVSEPAPERFHYESTWVLMSAEGSLLVEPAVLGAAGPWVGDAAVPADHFRWTDGYSNLLRVLR